MKRFTETGKWDDPWFGELSSTAKLLWMFLCDNCDHAGVWEVNRRLADFKIGTPIAWADAAAWFGDRVRVLDGGQKWLLPKFVKFQSPNGLNPKDKFSSHVLGRLKHHGLTLADIGMEMSTPRPGVSPESPVVPASADGSSAVQSDPKASASAGCPEGASKGDGRGMQAFHGECKERDSVRSVSRSRSVLDVGGSRGDGAQPSPAAPSKPVLTAGEVLTRALRKMGLDACKSAMQEWGDMLTGRGKCRNVDEVVEALVWIVDHARRDGLTVKYAKHAAQLADAWAANRRSRPAA